MRVIGGSSRGRRLRARLPVNVRPTSDKVREAVFDVLGSMGGVEGARVLDLFCGSGAMGVEALSRGAASVTFVDSDPAALAAVRANLSAVGLASAAAAVVRAELPRWLARAPDADLAFCDPPYRFSGWDPLLDSLRARTALLESGAPLDVPPSWKIATVRRYGGTLVTVVTQIPGKPTSSSPRTPATRGS